MDYPEHLKMKCNFKKDGDITVKYLQNYVKIVNETDNSVVKSFAYTKINLVRYANYTITVEGKVKHSKFGNVKIEILNDKHHVGESKVFDGTTAVHHFVNELWNYVYLSIRFDNCKKGDSFQLEDINVQYEMMTRDEPIKKMIVDTPASVKEPVVIDKPIVEKPVVKDLVSIIVPVYNAQHFIERCIQSALRQTYANIEVIVVDDCSTDKSYQLCNKFVSDENNLKLFRNNRNMGTYWSINYGITKASGEYFTLLGADDYYDIGKVSSQISAMKRYQCNVCLCKISRLSLDGKVLSTKMGESSIMFHKSVLEKIGYYDCVRFGADSEYLHRIETSKEKIVRLNNVLYLATQHPNSLTTNSESRKKGPAREFYEKQYREYYNKNNLYLPFPLTKRPYAIHNAQNI